MFSWLWKRDRSLGPDVPTRSAEERLREKYQCFRELLSLNSESLEVMAGLQEDLQYVTPERGIVEGRVTKLFETAHGIVSTLEKLSGRHEEALERALQEQRGEVERYIAGLQELAMPRFGVGLTEVGLNDVAEVGGKAAYLGEVKTKTGLPVPQGYVLTTEAYRQFFGNPRWKAIHDAMTELDVNDLESLHEASTKLQAMVMEAPLPRTVEVALTDRARTIASRDLGLAVRSSAVGEGGAQTFAGQFLSLINVPASQVTDAYRQVIAGRFSERALSYRLSRGVLEVESPMAVLVLPVVRAVASGIMYTRDPSNPKSKELWITSTRGLGLDIASGQTPADLFIVSRKRGHALVESHLAAKNEQLIPKAGGGIEHSQQDPEQARTPSLNPDQLATLAGYGVRIEDHFKCAQDVEWAMDSTGTFWILQSRPLASIQDVRRRSKAKPQGEPLVSGGRTIYPGQVSGPAFAEQGSDFLKKVPEGAILFLRRASPEMATVFSRIAGIVAEWGNVAGHVATLLREARVPSVFLMEGALERVETGAPVSLDAVQCKVYPGTLWEGREVEISSRDFYRQAAADPISRKILTLNLRDPAAPNFRASKCKSTHDVLRFCHERSVEAMFSVNDLEMKLEGHSAKDLKTDTPLNICVVDLGGGLALDDPEARQVTPAQIVSRPFQAMWAGVTYPGVTWKRDMPVGIGDIASVVASSFHPQTTQMRALGQKSYLLVADEYMNFNARLAYHFTLVDACLSGDPSRNYISFRFAGGGATRQRRNLRACFLEACLSPYGLTVDRRGDLVNAWLNGTPADMTSKALDILGRLLASTAQLDMYMTSWEAMNWYAEQFLAGNYAFEPAKQQEQQTQNQPD